MRDCVRRRGVKCTGGEQAGAADCAVVVAGCGLPAAEVVKQYEREVCPRACGGSCAIAAAAERAAGAQWLPAIAEDAAGAATLAAAAAGDPVFLLLPQLHAASAAFHRCAFCVCVCPVCACMRVSGRVCGCVRGAP